MKRLFVIATGNPGKIRDFAFILGTEKNEFKTLKDIGFDGDIDECGDSFAANAIIKSNTTAEWLAKKGIEATVLADDSGLEVFALNGEPGIYSARGPPFGLQVVSKGSLLHYKRLERTI